MQGQYANRRRDEISFTWIDLNYVDMSWGQDTMVIHTKRAKGYLNVLIDLQLFMIKQSG